MQFSYRCSYVCDEFSGYVVSKNGNKVKAYVVTTQAVQTCELFPPFKISNQLTDFYKTNAIKLTPWAATTQVCFLNVYGQ
jgi:hypothetical protein